MGLLGDAFNVMGGVTRAAYGASMWTGNSIYTALQNARTKKEIREIYNHASEANFQNRSVMIMPNESRQRLLLVTSDPSDNDIYDYDTKSSTPALDFIWGETDYPEGEVVSGGDTRTRIEALIPFVHKSQQEGIPLVVLHSSNKDIGTMIRNHSVDAEFIDRGGTYYDVFRGMPVDDISYLLYETMPDDDSNPSSESLLRALIEVVLRKEGTVTIQNLAAFPILNLKDELDKLLKKEEITSIEHKEIDRYYMAGSSETDAVRIFLNKLNRQAEGIYGKPSGRNSNIKKMLNQKGVISIDVGGVNNDLVVELVINHLMLLQSQGREFSILLDDIPISRFLKIRDLLRGRIYAISQKDFVSSLYGGDVQGDELFSELTGNVTRVVLFRHSSGSSCQKWSDFMGKYKKIRIRYNISQNNSFMNSSDSRGISVDETDEPRVRAETLGKLTGALACIYSADGILFAEV